MRIGERKRIHHHRGRIRERVHLEDVQPKARDRPGWLYDLARAISGAGCNIEVVMIDTEAHKALDVFYVTARGSKLDAPLQARLKSELLRACAGGA